MSNANTNIEANPGSNDVPGGGGEANNNNERRPGNAASPADAAASTSTANSDSTSDRMVPTRTTNSVTDRMSKKAYRYRDTNKKSISAAAAAGASVGYGGAGGALGHESAPPPAPSSSSSSWSRGLGRAQLKGGTCSTRTAVEGMMENNTKSSTVASYGMVALRGLSKNNHLRRQANAILAGPGDATSAGADVAVAAAAARRPPPPTVLSTQDNPLLRSHSDQETDPPEEEEEEGEDLMMNGARSSGLSSSSRDNNDPSATAGNNHAPVQPQPQPQPVLPSGGDADLAVAQLVEDDVASLMEAQEVDPNDIQRGSMTHQQKSNDEKRTIVAIAIIFVAILGSVLAIVLGLTLGRKNDEESNSNMTSAPPTGSPSTSPTDSPSSAPSDSLDLLMENLPPHTLQSLSSIDTPQWKAMEWLQNHPNITYMEEWRKTQLFALVCFYYAMEGDQWPSFYKDNWLLYDESECYWFSSVFGYFDETTGSYVEVPVPPGYHNCNERNEFTLIALANLKLSNYNNQPFIPPEIALLAALSNLALPFGDIHSPINEFLPTEIYQLTDLDYVELRTNQLYGSIPTQLGLLTQMSELSLHDNALLGSIPSELGLLTNMAELDLFSNHLEGQIPTELGMLTSLLIFKAEDNALTGLIPSELGFLGTNGSLQELTLANNSFSGTLSEILCSLGLFDPSMALGLSFDCSEDQQLCGCCWCPCSVARTNYSSSTATDCQSDPFIPFRDDANWPGLFPAPINTSTNVVTINIHTDPYPYEMWLQWSLLVAAEQQPGLLWWEVLDSEHPTNPNNVTSYTKEVLSNSFYRLQLFDHYGDGTCCAYGLGWFTITNSTSVVWEAHGGALESSLEVYLWIDSNGHAEQVDNAPTIAQGDGEDETVSEVLELMDTNSTLQTVDEGGAHGG